MRTVTEFPKKVREIENCWIELADGFRLAATVWLPEDAEREPVPGILEIIPYRKRDDGTQWIRFAIAYFIQQSEMDMMLGILRASAPKG